MKRIRVLVVDDSRTSVELLSTILAGDGRFELAGTASDGKEGVRKVRELAPDVVTMDIHMPVLDGYEATRQIMESHPVPIVIVSSSWDSGSVEKSMRAMSAGAVAALAKPSGPLSPRFAEECRELSETVAAMSEVKVVRRRPVGGKRPLRQPHREPGCRLDVRLVAIGASTGGPPVLETIVSNLPADYPLPVVVVQHIALGFLEGLVSWLRLRTAMKVMIAEHGARLEPGTVVFAPTDRHMTITREGVVCLDDEPPEYGTRPSVGYLFRSLARTHGSKVAAVLLTGMGRDGASELKVLRDAGATTICQDKESSAVWGMPGEADRIGAAQFVLPPPAIAEKLKRITGLWGAVTREV
jgi:two-component system chemotaxis response regulator CheB